MGLHLDEVSAPLRIRLGLTLSLCVMGLLVMPAFTVSPAMGLTVKSHSPILVTNNNGFTATNGVVSGSGTPSDPYVISGWGIDSSQLVGITVANTTVSFVIGDVSVNSGLQGFNDGIDLSNVTNALVENAIGTDNFFGLLLSGCSHVVAMGNYISSNTDGIVVRESSDIVLRDNTLVQNLGDAIAVNSSFKVVVVNNHASSNNGGIGANHSTYVLFSSNSVESSLSTGLYSELSTQIVFSNNTLNSNYEALGIDSSSSVMVIGNDISGSQAGSIPISDTLNSTVIGNTFSHNYGWDIFIFYSTGIRVYHNNFFQTFATSVVYDNYEINSWDNGYPFGGNFWFDYSGTDQCSGLSQNICPNSDGLGDTPYPVAVGGGADHYPLMKPFTEPLKATVNVNPHLLVSGSNAKYIIGQIQLPSGFNISNIDTASIRINGAFPAVVAVSASTQGLAKQTAGLIVEFREQQVKLLYPGPGDYRVQVTGNMTSETGTIPFAGSDTILILA